MDTVAIHLLCDIDHCGAIEVSRNAVLAQGADVSRHASVQGLGIHGSVDGHRFHAQCLGSLGDADGNFTAIGNQYTLVQTHVVSFNSLL